MKWLKRLLIVLALLVAVVVAIPFFISVDDYIPRIEKVASERLKEPVKIAKIRLSAVPVPHVTIDGISVGSTGDLTVGKVRVTPELLSLFSATKVIRSIEIDGVVLTQKGLDKVPLWSKQEGQPGEPSPVRVGALRLDDALVKLDKATIGPFDARVRLDEKGEPQEATIAMRDGKVKAVITPVTSGGKPAYSLVASAKAYKLPIGPPIVFDQLDIKGIATLTDANFSDITAKLYGGAASGKASVAWQKGLQVKGAFEISQLELKDLVPILSPGTKVSGRLNAKPVFSVAAPDAARLAGTLRLETPFNVQKGVLYGVDIQKAAMSLGKQAAGGETHFDQLSGHLLMEHQAFKFTGLQISSGALAADGNVTISPKKDLAGRVNAKVNALGTSASVAMNVTGTVQSPSVMPTGGTIAGAALGTAILPGIGTGVGAKAGQMIEGLFGKK